MSGLKFLIDGQLEDGALTMKVVNPATGKEEFDCPRADMAQLDTLAAAAAITPLGQR